MTEERHLPGGKSRSRNWRLRDDRADAVQGGSRGWTDDAVASEPHVLNKLHALRGLGESYSDVILRLAAAGRDPLNGS
jgi:hypothetical protein